MNPSIAAERDTFLFLSYCIRGHRSAVAYDACLVRFPPWDGYASPQGVTTNIRIHLTLDPHCRRRWKQCKAVLRGVCSPRFDAVLDAISRPRTARCAICDDDGVSNDVVFLASQPSVAGQTCEFVLSQSAMNAALIQKYLFHLPSFPVDRRRLAAEGGGPDHRQKGSRVSVCNHNLN